MSRLNANDLIEHGYYSVLMMLNWIFRDSYKLNEIADVLA